MRIAGAIVLCLAVLAVPVASGQIPVGAKAPELKAGEWINVDDPMKLSDLKGMVVVLYFWVSFHSGGERLIGYMTAIESNPGLGRRQGVAVIGVTDADRKRTEPTLNKEKVFFPVAVGSESYKDYQINVFPSVVVIDPEGKVAFAGTPTNLNEFVQKVIEIVQKSPPTKTHPLESPKVYKQLDAARDAMREGSYRTAYKQASEAFETAITGDTLKTRCEDFLDQLEALARDQVARIDPLIEQKKYADAVKILRETARDFKGTVAARTAARRLEALRGDYSEVAELLKGQEKENEARERLFAAQEMLRDRDIGPSYEEMDKIAREFAGTEAADAAKRIMGRMEKQEAMASVIRNHMASKDCEAWLSQARSYIRSRRNLDKARQLLHDIIRKYPRTSYADEAAEELSKLR